MSFGVTAVLMQTIYLATLNPDIGLHNDGVCATSGMYGGVSMPAGFPLWTMWAWFWAKVIFWAPVGWRISFGTALAGALASGIIALMVCRAGAELVGPSDEGAVVRVAAGVSAGLVFGLNGACWRQAVIPDPWTMSVLLVCVVLCLLMRWSHRPEDRRLLYAAAFAGGWMLLESQIEMALLAAIPFFVMLWNLRLGRDMFAVGGIIYLVLCCGVGRELWQEWIWGGRIAILHLLGWTAIVIAAVAIFKTRRCLTEWRALALCAGAFGLALAFSLGLPIASMTNPPLNWGYTRTPEGFFHVITRGQYDKVSMTDSLGELCAEMGGYAIAAGQDFGWPCVAAAALAIFGWRRFGAWERRWFGGLAIIFVFLSVLMVAVLNAPAGLLLGRMGDLVRMYFAASYIVLALFLGCGLMVFWRRIDEKGRS